MPPAAEKAVLPAEPADPKEREQKDLEPKSYADAAQETVEPKSDENDAIDYSNGDAAQNGGESSHQNGVNHSAQRQSNGINIGKKLEDDQVVFEKYSNGTYLTSVKPDPEYEDSLKHNAEVALVSEEPSTSKKNSKKKQDIPKPQLTQGRKAGAGWESSA